MPTKLVAPPAGLQGFIGYNSVGFPFLLRLFQLVQDGRIFQRGDILGDLLALG
jgi:hypothetical protein